MAMSRVAYVNGVYRQMAEALVHIEDRGYQFSDGVYEVCELRSGRLIDEEPHLRRLGRSLEEIQMAAPTTRAALGVIMREVVRRNRVTDGLVYLQVTRGVAPRGHAFPKIAVRPSLVVTVRASDPRARSRAEQGIAVITVPETRWARVDIKAIALLPNVLAKQQAIDAGAGEAWFVDADDFVNEGASSNAWIVTSERVLITAPTTARILEGITRGIVLEISEKLGLALETRRFSLREAIAANEAFITSATTLVTPVVRINGTPVGNGRVGPTSTELRRALLARP